jgi:ubiquinone biosynthesis protein
MSEQLGWRGLLRRLREEAPQWGTLLPQLPRLAHRALIEGKSRRLADQLAALAAKQRLHARLLWTGTLLLSALAALLIYLVAR